MIVGSPPCQLKDGWGADMGMYCRRNSSKVSMDSFG
jgi:hypothetical protein